MLILAGISIAQLTENGLFEKAKLAKEKQENAQEIENTTLANYENKIDEIVSMRENNYSEWTYLGTAEGIGSEVQLPNQFKELYVKTYCEGPYVTPVYIPKITLTGDENMRIGYGENNYQFLQISYIENSNKLIITSCYNAGTAVPGKIVVYYR